MDKIISDNIAKRIRKIGRGLYYGHVTAKESELDPESQANTIWHIISDDELDYIKKVVHDQGFRDGYAARKLSEGVKTATAIDKRLDSAI